MRQIKEEMAELYAIRRALAPFGYTVHRIDKTLGRGGAVITCGSCVPGEHDAMMDRDEMILASLPDNATELEFSDARRRWVESHLSGDQP
jgi:hypothetical protein